MEENTLAYFAKGTTTNEEKVFNIDTKMRGGKRERRRGGGGWGVELFEFFLTKNFHVQLNLYEASEF